MRGNLNSFFIDIGTIVRNRNTLSFTQNLALQRRLHTTEPTNSTVAVKGLTKWSLLKYSAKFSLVAGVTYGCYGRSITFDDS